MRNLSYENDFDLHENENARRTHFHMRGFALRLVLKQRDERARKWPILDIERRGTFHCFKMFELDRFNTLFEGLRLKTQI